MNTNLATISVAEAARRLGVSVTIVRKAIKLGQIPIVHLGSLRRIPVIALEEMLRHGRAVEDADNDAGEGENRMEGAGGV